MATIRHLLSGLALLGLILAPLVRPAMAGDSHSAMSVHDHAHSSGPSEGMAMPDDMPCCPDQAPTPDCVKHCPLMAMCMSQLFQNASAWTGPLVWVLLSSAVFPGDDPELSGQLHGPPRKPPKTSV